MTQSPDEKVEHVMLPDDDATRKVNVVHPDSLDAEHVSVGSAGDTYTILVGGEATGGRYCLIDMYVPGGSGPPLHRHDFDESFTVLEGEVEFFVRGDPYIVTTGATVTVPSNALHSFRNSSQKSARMLCVCVPSGLDEFFRGVGIAVPTRIAAVPRISDREMKEHLDKISPLAAKCRMVLYGGD